MTTFRYAQQQEFTSGASQSVKALTVEELAARLRSMTFDDLEGDDPSLLTEDEQLPYEQKVAQILSLLHHVNPKRIYRYKRKDDRQTKNKKEHRTNKREKILEAYGLLQSMGYKEQAGFARNYSDAFYLLMDSLFLEDIKQTGAGLIPGVSYEVSAIGEPSINPLIQLLEDPKYFNNERSIVDMVLMLCAQVQVQLKDKPEAVKKKEAFQEKVIATLKRPDLPYAYLLSEEEADGITGIAFDNKPPEIGEPKLRGYYIQLIFMLIQARKRGNVNNTRAIPAGFRFMNKGGGNGKYLELNGISLSDFQKNKEYNGRVFGLEFDEGGSVNIKGDLDDGYQAFLNEEKKDQNQKKDEAYLHVDGSCIPVKGMDYIADNMSMHFDASEFSNLDLTMHWEAHKEKTKNEAGDIIKAKNRKVRAYINIDGVDLRLSNVLYRSRSLDLNTGEVSDYSVIMEEVEVIGLSLQNMVIEGTQHEFRNFYEAVYRLTEGIQNALYLLIDAVLLLVTQMVDMEVTENDFRALNKDLVKTIVGGNTLKISLLEGHIKNYVDTDKKVLGHIPLNGLNIELGGAASEEKTLDPDLWSDRQRLKKLEAELAELYEKKAKFLQRHSDDFQGKKKYKDKFDEHYDQSEIYKKKGEVEELRLEIQDKLKSPLHLSISSEDPLEFKRAWYVSQEIKQQITAGMGGAGMPKITGLDTWEGLQNFSVQGITIESDIGVNHLDSTTLTIPFLNFPMLSSPEIALKTDAVELTANSVDLKNMTGYASMRWQEKEEDPGKYDLIPTEIGLLNGRMEVENLVLRDVTGVKPQVRIAGKSILQGMSFWFKSLDKGEATNYEDFEVYCSGIKIEDAGEFQMQLKEHPEMENWIVERTDNYIILNGFSIKNYAESDVKKEVVDGKTQLFTTKKMEFDLLGAQFNKIHVDGFPINTSFTYFNTQVTKKSIKAADGETTTDEETTLVTSFGIPEVKIKELDKETKNLRITQFQKNQEDTQSYISRMEAYLIYHQKMVEYYKRKGSYFYAQELYTSEQKAEDIKKHQDIVNATAYKLKKARDWVGAFEGTIFKEIEGEVTTVFKKEVGSDKNKLDSITINTLKAGRLQTQNVRLTNKLNGRRTEFVGMVYMENFGISGVGVEMDKSGESLKDKFKPNFEDGGTIFGGLTFIPQITGHMFEAFDVGASSWYFTKLVDNKGLRYGINDLMGDYTVRMKDGGRIDGDIHMSITGGMEINEDREIIDLTLSTKDLVKAPYVKMDGFELEPHGGHVGLHGIDLTAKIKYKKTVDGDDTSYSLRKVTVDSLTIGRLYMTGSRVKLPKKVEIDVDADKEIWLENVVIQGLEYDALSKDFSFPESVETGKFDLSEAMKTSLLDEKGGIVLDLIRGGISGDAINFTKASDGDIEILVTSPNLLVGTLNFGDFLIGNKDKDYANDGTVQTATLFKAGTIEYHSKKDEEEGHYITVTNGEFTGLPLSGNFELDGKTNSITNFVFSGKVGDTLQIDVVGGFAHIVSSGSTLNIEEVEIYMPDVEKPPKQKAKPEDRNNDGEISDDEMEFFYAVEKMKERIQFMAKFNEKYNAYNPEVENDVREDLGFTREYLNECENVYNSTNPVYLFLLQDPELQKKYDDYKLFLDTFLQRTAGNVSDDFIFLDHMTSGDVTLSLFEEDADLDYARVNPITGDVREGLPASLITEENLGGGYYTYINAEDFIVQITEIFGRNIDRVSYLSNAVGPGELYTDEHMDDEFNSSEVLYSDIVMQKHLLTLIAERNPYNVFIEDETRWLRLSSVFDTVFYNQAIESMMRATPEDMWNIEKSIESSIKNYTLDLLHHDMKPEITATNVSVNLKDKDVSEKGLLDFVTSDKENLKFDFAMKLNQSHRYSDPHARFWQHKNYKQLGPQLSLKNVLLPAFHYDDYKNYVFAGDGIEIESVEFLKEQLDTPNYRHGGTLPFKKRSARIVGKNVKIRDFDLKIPVKTK